MKEGSKISISDSPDKHQTLLGILEGNTLNKNKKIYKIDAPSMEEQEKEGGLNIKGSVDFATRLNKSLSFDKNGELIIDNNASISAVGFDSVSLEESADNTNKSSAKTSYKVVDSKEINPGKLEGTAYVPAHMGPNDEIGNPEPYKPDKLKSGELLRVDETALLGFAFNFTSHAIKGVNGTHNASNDYYSDYRLEYIIDKNLIFQEVTSIKDEFIYVPNSDKYGKLDITYPDEVKPRYNIVGYSGEGSSKKPLFKIENPGKGETFTRKELGLEDTDRVDIVAFEFDYAPVGMYLKPREYIMPKLVFSIEKGYRGEVWNDMRLFIKGDPEEKSQYIVEGGFLYGDHQPKKQKDKRQVFHRRGAMVVDKTIDYKIVGDISVRLNKNTNGKVSVGENTLNIEYKNLSTSNGDMKENVGLVLLPGGVKAINDGSLSIINNFAGTGRQLIAFNIEEIYRLDSVRKEIEIEITDKAPRNLIFDAELYPNIDLDNNKIKAELEAVDHNTNNPLGAYDNTIKVHKNYILGLDLENKDIFKKLLDSPEIYRKKLRTNTIYNLIDGYGLTTEHKVGLDRENWTDLVKVLDEDEFYYKLHVKNETDKAVSSLKIVDIFPHIGDLGITDNIPRDSEIFINDIESIQIVNKKGDIKEDIKDKFNIYYVEEANINKDEFFDGELTKESKPDNPEGAVNPNWKEVNNGGFKAGALKIELKPGYNLNIGEEVEVIIKAKSPVTGEVIEAIGKEKFEEVSQLTAWNSFAVSSKEFQTVEPKRVGVQIGIAESPGIKKELVGLANDSELVKGSHVKYKLSSDIGSIENVYKILIEDQLDERLEDVALSVDLINKDGEKINNTPEVLEVDDSNKIIFKTENKDIIQQLENGKINLFIEARLKADASDEWLENQATIQVNNNPKEKTEIVRIKPITPTEPVIEKTVEGDKDGIVNYGEAFKYVINNTLPNDINEYKQYRIVDKLDDRLDILDVKVLIDNINLEDSSQDIKLNQEGNEVSLIIEDLEKLKGKSEIVLVFEVKLNTNEADITIDNEVKLISENNRDGETKELTDEVRVKTPENPKVEKSMIDLEDGQELVEGKEFSYKISTEFEKAIGYDSFILKDNLDPDLELLSAEVWVDNTKNENLSQEVSVDKEKNVVSLEIKDGWDELKGKKLDLVINVKLKESLKDRVNNEASFKLNNNPEEKTNIVGVKPIKPTEPEIKKEALELKNQDEKIVNYGEKFKYKITNSLPNDIEEYENYIIEDELDEALDLQSVKVTIGEEEKEFTLVDREVSGEIKGTKLTVKDNKLELEVEGFNQLEGLEEIVLELNVKLKEDAKIENNILPNNAKVTYKDKERKEGSKEDREIVKTPKDPKLSKDIKGQGLNGVIAKGSEFDYILTTKLIDIEGYEKVLIKDELDEKLEYISSVVKIDGKEDINYKTSDEDKTVSLKLNKDQIEELKGKKIEIFIRVKVKEGIEIAAIDNEAKIQINNNPEKPSNKVTINPKPKDLDLPNILKEVNKDKEKEVSKNKEDIRKKDIVNYGEEFKYTLTSKLPENLNQYESYRITDTIDENLELISIAVKVMDDEVRTLDLSQNNKLDTFDSKLSVEGQKVTFEITEFEKFQGKEGKEKDIALTFTVKLKDNAVLERHQIDNTAELIFKEDTDSEEKEKSSSVTVIVPENPGIEKELVDLNEFDKVVQGTKFAYKVSSFLDDLDNVNKITLEDELDKRLSFEGAQVELNDGTILDKDKYSLNHDQESNTVSLVIDDKDALESLEGKTLSLVIQVRLDYGDDISLVENQASVRVNNNPKNETEKVTVVPEKPTEPKLTKKVEGDKEGTVNYEEEFSYTLSNEIPNDIEDYKFYKLSDKLDDKLELIGLTISLDGEKKSLTKKDLDKEEEIMGLLLSEENNLLEVEVKDFASLEGKSKLDLILNVKLKENAEEGEIRNIANLEKQSKRDKKPEDIPTNEVVVKTPKTPDINKEIKNKDSYAKDKPASVLLGESIEYSIKVPVDNTSGYEKIYIEDIVDERLDIEDVKVFIIGEESSEELEKLASISANKVQVEITDQNIISKLDGKEVEVLVKAKVKTGINLDIIENTASIKINNNPNKNSNTVYLKPKTPIEVEIPGKPEIPEEKEKPNIEKRINGLTKLENVEIGKEYAYTVDVSIPSDINDYKKLVIEDRIDDRLIIKDINMRADGKPYSNYSLSQSGNLVTANFMDIDDLTSISDLSLEIVIELKDLDYKDGDIISNIAKIIYEYKDDEIEGDIPSNEVVIVPPIKWEKDDPDKPGLEEPGENPEGDGSGNNKPNRPGGENPEGDGSASNKPNRPGGDNLGSGLLPKTGDASSIYISLLGLGLMLLGYALLKKRENA